jgi:hypothetical protein
VPSWSIKNVQLIDDTTNLETGAAFLLNLEADDREGQVAAMTVEWLDEAMGSETAARAVGNRYLSRLGEDEMPAARIVVDREGDIIVDEAGR